MFGWFTPKSPLTDDRRDWIDWRMRWLREEFGEEPLRRRVVTPTDECFPDPYAATHQDIEWLFRRVCEYMGVERSRIHLHFCQNDSAAGLYQKDDSGKITIWLEDSRLDVADSLVSTMAHELAHVHLLADGHLSRDESDQEHVADLLTVYFGFGIFKANTTRRDESGYQGGWSWHHVRYSGYLEMYELAYAIAVYARARGEDSPSWIKYLRADVLGDLTVEMKNIKSGRRRVYINLAGDERNFVEVVRPEFSIPTTAPDRLEAANSDATDGSEADFEADTAMPDDGHLDFESPADDFFTAGIALATAGKCDQAIESFSRAIELDSNDSEAFERRSLAFLQLGRFSESIDDACRCLAQDPRNASALCCRAQSYLEMARYSEALSDLNSAFKIVVDANLYFLRGMAHFGLGNYQQAIREFTMAICKSPQTADYYLGRSRAYRAIGRTDLSQADLNESNGRNPDFRNDSYRKSSFAYRICRGG